MKRVDIVDVKADIRDGELLLALGYHGEILLHDVKTQEAVCLGKLVMNNENKLVLGRR